MLFRSLLDTNGSLFDHSDSPAQWAHAAPAVHAGPSFFAPRLSTPSLGQLVPVTPSVDEAVRSRDVTPREPALASAQSPSLSASAGSTTESPANDVVRSYEHLARHLTSRIRGLETEALERSDVVDRTTADEAIVELTARIVAMEVQLGQQADPPDEAHTAQAEISSAPPSLGG